MLRAYAKFNGISQKTLASRMGITEPRLSRVINRKRGLSFEFWLDFCNATDVSPNSIANGYITPGSVNNTEYDYRENRFGLPKKYATFYGSTAKLARPLMEYFERRLGTDALSKHLKEHDVDPDHFLFLDTRQDMQFTTDLMDQMVRQGVLNAHNVADMTKTFATPYIHGDLNGEYRTTSRRLHIMEIFAKNALIYETNHIYRIENVTKTHFDFSVTPEWHLNTKKLRHGSLIPNMHCLLIKNNLQTLSHCDHPNHHWQDIECYHTGSKRCLYRIPLQ